MTAQVTQSQINSKLVSTMSRHNEEIAQLSRDIAQIKEQLKLMNALLREVKGYQDTDYLIADHRENISEQMRRQAGIVPKAVPSFEQAIQKHRKEEKSQYYESDDLDDATEEHVFRRNRLDTRLMNLGLFD